MKSVRLRLDEDLIERAREYASREGVTLDDLFERWLREYTRQQEVDEAMAFLDRIRAYARTGGRTFTRDEMNERR